MRNADARAAILSDRKRGMSRRDFLASSFLAGSTAGLYARAVGAEAPPMPRPKPRIVFEDGVFAGDVFA